MARTCDLRLIEPLLYLLSYSPEMRGPSFALPCAAWPSGNGKSGVPVDTEYATAVTATVLEGGAMSLCSCNEHPPIMRII